MQESRPDVLTWLAEALGKQQAGNLSGALLTYRRILSRDPDNPDALCNMGSILHSLGRNGEALEALQRALAVAPANPAAHNGLGSVRGALGDLGGAEASFGRALELDPGNLVATSNRAGILARLGRLEEALAADRQALARVPHSPELNLNLGHTLMRLGRLEEAEPALLEALARAPGMAKARWNLSYLRLLQGRYREAWPDFGARLEVPQGLDNLRGFPQSAWDGRPFPGRTLLVWAEQGLGDTLQFARYLPMVKALGGTVLFQTYTAILGVLQGVAGADQVLPEHAELPAFDLHSPLLDLPALFGSTPEDLPAPAPLGPPPGHVPPAAMAALLAGPERKAGLVWAGSRAHQDDARRSLDPALLAPLAGLPGLRWVSLQVGAPPPWPGVADLGPALRDFSDTAWALARLERLVTVDTAVAHLAGSMGVRTHLLLPFFPDWRWRMAGPDCPWYPSVRIHRQPAPGAWEPVLADLAAAIRGEAAHGA